MTIIETQAPICPFCQDDHSTLKECNIKDLKKELLIIDIEELECVQTVEKERLIRMVQYL